MKKLCLLALLLVSGCALSETPAQPADVQQFLKVADDCQYLAGEWDSSLPEARKREIEKESKDVCGKATAEQKTLKIKYKDDPKIIEKLNEYDF